MKYNLIASSRSRTTEVYQNKETDKLVEVYYYKSGRVEYTPITEIPNGLTVRYKDSDESIESNGNSYIAPVQK